MNLFNTLRKFKTIFLDTAPVIYFIEAHYQFGPMVREIIELMDKDRIQAFTSVLTLSEVLPKPVQFGNNEMVDKFNNYLKNGKNLTLLPITETIGESAGKMRGKYPHLKTVDAIQIAAALDAEVDVYLTNDKKLFGIKEIKIIVLSNFYEAAQDDVL